MFVLKVSMWLRIKRETKNRKGQEMLSRLKHEISRNSDSGSSLTRNFLNVNYPSKTLIVISISVTKALLYFGFKLEAYFIVEEDIHCYVLCM